jgi:hypothetical protein
MPKVLLVRGRAGRAFAAPERPRLPNDRSLPRPAGSNANGGLFPSATWTPSDETIAVGEKRGVYEVALIARPHHRGVVARPAPAFAVEV